MRNNDELIRMIQAAKQNFKGVDGLVKIDAEIAAECADRAIVALRYDDLDGALDAMEDAVSFEGLHDRATPAYFPVLEKLQQLFDGE